MDKVAVYNLGCKVNRVESDSIAASYHARGLKLVPLEEADLIVVNTCTVTAQAEKKTRKAVRGILRTNTHAQVLVTGCAASINPNFYANLDSRIVVVDKADLIDATYTYERVGDAFPTRVGVKVQDGCNHTCTYCIVHVARGKAWSRPLSEIIREVDYLIAQGAKEIVLTGIDLGSYHTDDGSLPFLLQELLQRDTTVRYRLSSIEPRSLSDKTLELLAHSEGRLCRHLHIPLQSGSTRVLKEMNRPYRAEYFAALCDKAYEKVEGLALTTDIIVGFPGETEKDFEQTLEMSKHARFSKIHVFPYSLRQGTPAAARLDQIDPSTKTKRAKILGEFARHLRDKEAHKRIGSTEYVLVEQDGSAMSESYYKVALSQSFAIGSLIPITLTDYDETGMFRS